MFELPMLRDAPPKLPLDGLPILRMLVPPILRDMLLLMPRELPPPKLLPMLRDMLLPMLRDAPPMPPGPLPPWAAAESETQTANAAATVVTRLMEPVIFAPVFYLEFSPISLPYCGFHLFGA
jgi:hypothetical protein